MNGQISNPRMADFNALWKEQNEIYRMAAKRFGIAESVMWILYFLREGGGCRTQRDICSSMIQPKQTTNSAIKQMEKQGLITMADGDDRRVKLVKLTAAGSQLAGRTADIIINAENRSMDSLTQSEQEQLTSLLRKYNNTLKKEMGDNK